MNFQYPNAAPPGIQPLPRRFRTAYIIFSSVRHKEIRQRLGGRAKNEKTANISRLVAAEWRSMTSHDKAIWQAGAQEDKRRYMKEMSLYKGHLKSHGGEAFGTLPKRPMSAYLAFSNKRRGSIKRRFPQASNADISKMLAREWKEAAPDEKASYIEEEARLRAQYLIDMAPFRKKGGHKSAAKGTPETMIEPNNKEAPNTARAYSSGEEISKKDSGVFSTMQNSGNTRTKFEGPSPLGGELQSNSSVSASTSQFWQASLVPQELHLAAMMSHGVAAICTPLPLSNDEALLLLLEDAKQEVTNKIVARRREEQDLFNQVLKSSQRLGLFGQPQHGSLATLEQLQLLVKVSTLGGHMPGVPKSGVGLL